MKPRRDGYHHGNLRQALVEAATTLVRDVGEEGFSLRDAARVVGVTPNATYRHFESKAALLTAVAAGGVERLAQRMRRKLADVATAGAKTDVALDCFRAAGRAYFSFALDQPELFRVVYGTNGMCRFARPTDLASCPEPYRILGETLDGLVRVGLLPPERRAGGEVRAWAVIHGFASLVIDGTSVFATAAKRSEALEDLLDFALRGLCAEAPTRRAPQKKRG